jgi:hypothetical protein
VNSRCINLLRALIYSRLCVLTLAGLCLLHSQTVVAQSTTNAATEIEVKAAMLYRAAKFIDWPAAAFADERAPFALCVMGDAEVLRAFATLHGRTLGQRSVTVRRITGDVLDLRQCHAAFIAREHAKDSAYAIEKLRGLPVLTASEIDGFAARGGMLELTAKEQRVRFAFNLPASKTAGLIVSSQLLKLATVVGTTP